MTWQKPEDTVYPVQFHKHLCLPPKLPTQLSCLTSIVKYSLGSLIQRGLMFVHLDMGFFDGECSQGDLELQRSLAVSQYLHTYVHCLLNSSLLEDPQFLCFTFLDDILTINGQTIVFETFLFLTPLKQSSITLLSCKTRSQGMGKCDCQIVSLPLYIVYIVVAQTAFWYIKSGNNDSGSHLDQL